MSFTVPRAFSYFVLLTVFIGLGLQIGPSIGELNSSSISWSTQNILVESLYFHQSLSEYRFLKIEEFDYLALEEMVHFTRPGEPYLPMRRFVVELSKNAEIVDVSTSNKNEIPIQGRFDIVPTPEPLTWGFVGMGEYKKDQEVYALDEYFPGEVWSYRVGEDNQKKYLYLSVFPVQYLPTTGEVKIITDLTVDIRYRYLSGVDPLAEELNSDCIVITPPELYPEAKDLSDFHENSLGVSSTVVNTTWIDANYEEAEDPPFSGYWDILLPNRDKILGYNYSLAKKTVKFLRNESAHPNLKYVLLYGNAALLPPSFYWYDFFVGGFLPYEGWIPTDFFYSSPDYDLTPNYAVGRLPVDSSMRAQSLNQKIKDWFSNLSTDWFYNAAVAGGRPFDTSFYVGELINQDAIDKGYFDGLRLTKMYLTDGRFGEADMLEVLSGEYGIVYEIGHGVGDAILLNESSGNDDAITVAEVMSLNTNSNVSVFVSIACDNGAFDNTVVTNKPFTSAISFGESLLFSPAGAIAYVGGARSNSGSSIGTLEEGEVNITGEVYMAHILTSFWRAYSEGAGRLGNISMNALGYFTASQNMNDIQNKRALFGYVLLGDPVLPMTHPQESGYRVPTTQISEVVKYEYYGDPMIVAGHIPVVPLGEPNSMHVETDSPGVRFKVVDAVNALTLEYGSNTTLDNRTQYDFTPSRSSVFLLRAEGEDGKEGWQYLTSKFVVRYPRPPVLMLAKLNGPDRKDVAIGWYKSTDEGHVSGTVRYEVFRSGSINGSFTKIGDVAATGQSSYVYVDPARGDGDPSNYFYYVQSVNSSGRTSKSNFAGKYVMSLTEGWHLISLPLIQEDTRTAVVFQTLDYESVLSYLPYDPTEPWKRYDSFKGFGDLENVDHLMGLWVKVRSTDEFTIAGLVPRITQITLYPGWNLVSYPTFYPKKVSEELQWNNYERIEGYEPASQPYCLRELSPSDVMDTGSAYWIRVGYQQSWIVRNPS